MPLVRLETSAKLAEETKQKVLGEVAEAVSRTMGKPIQYVMVTIGEVAMSLSANQEPALFADVRSIGGLSSHVNNDLCKAICAIVKEHCEVDANRVYLNFTDISASNWGLGSSTFG